MKFSFNKKKLKYGSISSVFIIFFVIVLVLVNVLASFLTERFSLKLDLTSEGRYSLSEETKELLGEIDEDVNIYVLSTRATMEKGTISNHIVETLQRYNSESGGKISFEFIDPNKNPAFFEKYPKARGSQDKALVVESEKRYLVVESAEFAYTYGDNENRVYYDTEEKISSAILHVISDEVSTAAFVTGHNEAPAKMLSDIFAGNNFGKEEIDLLKGIPDDVNNLVICAPQADFAEQEIAALDKYLAEEGNNLYVFWGVGTQPLPLLEQYLSEWGFAFEPQVICDETNAYSSEYYIIPEVVGEKFADKEAQGDYIVISPRTRTVKLLWAERGLGFTTEILRTQSSAYAKTLSADTPIKTLKRESGDLPGPFTVAAMSERLTSASMDAGHSRVFAFGSADFVSEETAGISRAYNSRLMSQIIDYANPNTLTLAINPKVDITYDLNITEGGASLLRILLNYVLPLLIIAGGVFVFIRRRNR